MPTKIVQKNGAEYVHVSKNDVRERGIYKVYASDVVENGDGTFSIPSITDASECDIAHVRGSLKMYEYDEKKKIWWPL